tara:strand:+ start:1120 stop:1548 length:429 start_codon:yes stop_codon:yes gene_type:complete
VTVFVLPPSVVVVALASALATTTDDDDDDDVEFLFGYLRSAFFGPPFRRVAFVSLKALPLLDSSVGAFVDVATNATLVVAVVVVDAHMLFLSLSLSFYYYSLKRSKKRDRMVCVPSLFCVENGTRQISSSIYPHTKKNEMKP